MSVELLDGPAPAPRTVRRLALVAVVLVLAVAVVGEQRLRAGADRRVAACAEAAGVAVQDTHRMLASVAGFVRPVLDRDGGAGLREEMDRIVSEAASGADLPLEVARVRCAAVDVPVPYRSLDERRDRCVAVLAGQAGFVRDVARDGSALRDWPSLPTRC
jgi:hypothetical protein